jgi:hypothetical protein
MTTYCEHGRPATGGLLNCLQCDQRKLAAMRARAPLKPRAPQNPCDLGLFSDDARQLDLVTLSKETPPCSTPTKHPEPAGSAASAPIPPSSSITAEVPTPTPPVSSITTATPKSSRHTSASSWRPGSSITAGRRDFVEHMQAAKDAEFQRVQRGLAGGTAREVQYAPLEPDDRTWELALLWIKDALEPPAKPYESELMTADDWESF